VSTRDRFYGDLAFSPGGSFGRLLYVTDCVSKTVMSVEPAGGHRHFASGFDFRAAEGGCGGSVTVTNDGEHMFVADARGIYCIRPATLETESPTGHIER
jgi:hypothetical protein